jgi:adenosylcobinamide-phosphate synthase
MTLLSIIVALFVEQYRPLPAQRWVIAPLARYFAFLDRQFNDGVYRHGIVAWLFGVATPALLVAILYALLAAGYPLLDLAMAVGILYLTMGFRQFSHHFTDIQQALQAGELDRARKLLADWRGVSGDRLSSNEIARLSMEQALIASHRHVFAPLICFALLGPGGALLYRLALFAREYWQDKSATAQFGIFAQRAFHAIDWLPLRLTAIGFAITGDFEDAVFCWRTQAGSWPDTEQGILLASGAGALGVRLGLPVQDVSGIDHAMQDRPEMGLGDEADADFMQSAIGLAWRTLLLILLLTALVWVASWVG